MSRYSTNTTAHHLHEILSSVYHSSESRLRAAWQETLGESWNSPEFARKHAETVSLLNSTIRDTGALSDAQQARTARYFPAWWQAVVTPDHAWHADKSRDNVISSMNLDFLAVTADLIAGTLAGTSSAPSGGDLTKLREKCEEWVTLLEGISPDQISDNLRDQLAKQAQHVMWLIDNSEFFGSAHVAQEAEGFTGALTQAIGSMPQTPTRGKLMSALFSILGVLMVFNQGFDQAQASIEHVGTVFHEIERVTGDASE